MLPATKPSLPTDAFTRRSSASPSGFIFASRYSTSFLGYSARCKAQCGAHASFSLHARDIPFPRLADPCCRGCPADLRGCTKYEHHQRPLAISLRLAQRWVHTSPEVLNRIQDHVTPRLVPVGRTGQFCTQMQLRARMCAQKLLYEYVRRAVGVSEEEHTELARQVHGDCFALSERLSINFETRHLTKRCRCVRRNLH